MEVKGRGGCVQEQVCLSYLFRAIIANSCMDSSVNWIRPFFFSWLPHNEIGLTESAAFVYPAFISGGRTTGP